MILQSRAVRNVKRIIKSRPLLTEPLPILANEYIPAHINPFVIASLQRLQNTYKVDPRRWKSPNA